jgi:hypothetical protein
MDDSIAARMGEEAYRRYWAEPQTVEVHTRNLVSVYRTVLSGARASARAALGDQAA